VLGTGDSADYARAAGVTVVDASTSEPADAILVADEGGFDLLRTLDDTLSMTIEAVRRGRAPYLFLANPDLVYPSGKGTFGLTAGSLAMMLERALEMVLGEGAPKFEILGKPSRRIFTEALARVGTTDAVMIGDQLHTDIAGAQSVNIASALMLGGVSQERPPHGYGEFTPTYILRSL
jgi:ribonucleotide monophosphatase NagD (HAD superfamily)